MGGADFQKRIDKVLEGWKPVCDGPAWAQRNGGACSVHSVTSNRHVQGQYRRVQKFVPDTSAIRCVSQKVNSVKYASTPLGGVREFRSGRIPGCQLTTFAPHTALKLIEGGKLTFNKRVVLHRVVQVSGAATFPRAPHTG